MAILEHFLYVFSALGHRLHCARLLKAQVYRSRCLIEGMKGKGKIVMAGKIGKKGKIGCH
jgi:hypothetical protein